MITRKATLWRRTVILADMLVLVGAFLAGYQIRSLHFFARLDLLKPMADFGQYLEVLPLVIVVYAFAFYFFGFYKDYLPKSFPGLIWPALRACIAGTLLLAAALFVFKIDFFSRAFFVQFAVLLTTAVIAEKVLALAVFQWLRGGSVKRRHILVIGTRERIDEAAKLFGRHERWGFTVVGALTIPNGESAATAGGIVLGTAADLSRVLSEMVIDDVVFALPKNMLIDIEKYLWECEQTGVSVHIIANFFNVAFSKTYLDSISGIPVLTYSSTPRSYTAAFVKRAFDIGVSGLLLALGFPAAALYAAVAYALGKRPLLARKPAAGYFGREFEVYSLDCEGTGRAGAAARKLLLDRLPVMVNILRGDMSLVGPGLATPEEARKYDPWQRRRLSAKPGLVGAWYSRRAREMAADDGVRLDLEYIDNWSVWLDIKLLIMTAPRLFFRQSRRGARPGSN